MAKKKENEDQIKETKSTKAKETKTKEVKKEPEVVIVNKNKGHGLLIFLLLLIIIALALYICYDKGLIGEKDSEIISTVKNDDKDESEVKETEKTEVLEVVSNDVKHLFNTLTSGTGQYCGIWNYFSDKKVTTEDISNDLAASIVLNSLYNNGMAINRKATVFTKDQMDAEMRKIFGKDYQYTHKDIDICPSYKYDEKEQTYTVGDGQCSGACGAPNKAKIVKALKKNDKIEIYVRVLFSSLNDSVSTVYYKDVNKTQPINVEKAGVVDYYISDETYAEGSLYKMTFNLEDGNYIFAYSEPVTK